MTAVPVQCACPGCSCAVEEATAMRRGNQLFCSQACANGHINSEPCHGHEPCGCSCAG
ncbi:metallothionein/ family 14 [Synechococcus sp. BIOS-E4-1]|uniref:conjugal transfer protein TrbI n=1 Tax=Synechococcus sp. BIOS-E4-1 TaxID=1400864 RepID=UPI0016470325|nr:conjugal transfer protein TrbI [Synechococcus sp. BIOS-E4-1]QNI53946.1 metallothionein/ family 14 [Synechococcus sp. BIOS-E4-1]